MAQAALLLWEASLPYYTGWLYRPDLPKFTWVSKFQAAAQIFTISCENSEILSRLLSVLSLHWKFIYNHCCCPNPAIILTVSKMEAVLDCGRGCQNLSIILWVGRGEGGTLPQPSNPDNMAAGGATDAQRGVGEVGGLEQCRTIYNFIAFTPTYEKALNETKHLRRRRIVKLSSVGEGAECR